MRPVYFSPLVTSLAIGLAAGSAGAGDFEIGLYGGVQGAVPSPVSGSDPGGVGDFDFDVSWEGRSFTAPPYWGLRLTKWQTDNFGWGLDYSHAKVYAPESTKAAEGFDVLEFSDGLNILTLNAYYAWDLPKGRITPYVGGGVGVAFPHVEVTTAGGSTFGYQVTGPAATWILGASYDINDRWSVFGEYKGSYSSNSADLGSGGTLDTDIFTNAVNIGVAMSF